MEVSMGSTRRRFTDEYKREAVSFVIDGGRSIAEVAHNIGVSETGLGAWVKKAKESGDEPEKPLDISERAELERLREENTHLQMQLAFAKKVATWFAKDQR
jgi:transposase